MTPITLNAEQKKEWHTLFQIVKWYSLWVTELNPTQIETLKRFHFGMPPIKPAHGFEMADIESALQQTFLTLILDPDQTQEHVSKVINASRAMYAAGNSASNWPVFLNKLFRNTGYSAHSGHTEWTVSLFLEAKKHDPAKWLENFRFSGLWYETIKWLESGGYRQFPIVPLISSCFDAYIKTITPLGWEESYMKSYEPLFKGIFHFKDPESLSPRESPYYYFASRIQHYLCKEAQLPKPLEQYIIKSTGLKVSRLNEFECLPILLRPACYDQKFVTPEPAIIKAKGKKAVKEEEFYDEAYPAPSEDYPRPPLRYIGNGKISGKITIEQVLALFKQHKFIARLPKVSEGDPASDLSHSVLKTPPKIKTKAWIAKFKPHMRFAMSDELDLSVRILASAAPLPVATTVFESDEDTGEPCDIEVKEEQCNLALYIEPSLGEEIPDDSTLAKNIQTILAEIKKTLGIDLHESVPPEHVPEG